MDLPRRPERAGAPARRLRPGEKKKTKTKQNNNNKNNKKKPNKLAQCPSTTADSSTKNEKGVPAGRSSDERGDRPEADPDPERGWKIGLTADPLGRPERAGAPALRPRPAETQNTHTQTHTDRHTHTHTHTHTLCSTRNRSQLGLIREEKDLPLQLEDQGNPEKSSSFHFSN